MFCRLLVAAALAITCIGTLPLTGQTGANAKEKDVKKNKDIETAVANGPGVHVIERDDKGRIHTCLIVGQARISTVLGKAEGLLNAKEKARLACEAEFVKWLKTSVDVHSKNEKETILFLEGSQDNDKETLKESGKSVDKTQKTIESVAKGLFRGFQPVHTNADTKEKLYTLVIRWNAQDANAAGTIEKGKE